MRSISTNYSSCAHEMNVISTASILPRTPTDVNGMLSVVFVGAGKLNAQSLHNMFRVRKKEIEEFLIWLKNHNHLYMDIPTQGARSHILFKILKEHLKNTRFFSLMFLKKILKEHSKNM